MKELLQGPLPALKSWASEWKMISSQAKQDLWWQQPPEEWVCSLSQVCSFNQLTTYWGQRKYRLRRRVFRSIHGHMTEKETRTLRLRVFLPHSSLNVSGYILANSFLLFSKFSFSFPTTQIKVLTTVQKRQSDWRANQTSPEDWWRIFYHPLREELEYHLLFRKQHHGRQKDNLAVVFICKLKLV